MPRIFSDFHNADEKGRLRLNCTGTIEDLKRKSVEPHGGDIFTLYSEDIEVEGVVEYSSEENIWVASVDWEAIKERRGYPELCQLQALADLSVEKGSNKEENQVFKYTSYEMYLQDKRIGIARYRLYNTQSPYWYIDELLVFSEKDRGRGYGTYLLCCIIAEMWNERKIPIHIYPTDDQIPKNQLIEWLIRRDFVPQTPLSTGNIFYILFPDLE
jgi:hypothetical protein